MSMYSEAAESYQTKGSSYDALDAVPHVDDYQFHELYATNQCASAVMQGFARFMYFEKTGEPAAPYAVLHKTLTPFELKVFLRAFGYKKEDLPDDVNTLWEMILSLFEPKKTTKKAASAEKEA